MGLDVAALGDGESFIRREDSAAGCTGPGVGDDAGRLPSRGQTLRVPPRKPFICFKEIEKNLIQFHLFQVRFYTQTTKFCLRVHSL